MVALPGTVKFNPFSQKVKHNRSKGARRGLPGQLAGDEGGFALRQVLRGGDVVACHARELLVLHLGLGHVVVAGIKVFLLGKKKKKRNLGLF